MLSFAVQRNGLTAQVSVVSPSFLLEMRQHDSPEEWWSVLCALLEANRVARTRHENWKFANEYGRIIFDTESQHVEHETKSAGQTKRVTVANPIDAATE